MNVPPNKELALALRLEQFRIVNFPSRVFVCGGELKSELPSGRATFLAHVGSQSPEIAERFILAEEISQWYRDGRYEDLLLLEQDLVHLADITLLFVESPGSIAELGAFSLLKPLNQKLVVVFESCQRDVESFITQGPLRHIETKYNRPILYYPLGVDGSKGFSQSDAANLLDDLEEHLAPQSQEREFDQRDRGHALLLIADLVSLMVIPTRTEIDEVLKTIGCAVESTDLDKALFLLEKLHLVESRSYGRRRLYYRHSANTFLHYGYSRNAKYNDRMRWVSYFREHHLRDPMRESTLRIALAAAGPEQPS